MADNNLPAQPSAQDGGNATPPPAPDVKPAENTPAGTPQSPATPFDSLTDDQKKYLKGQGIESLDSESLLKLVNHAQSSQKTAADLKNRLDAATSAINPQVPAVQSSQPQPNIAPIPASDGIDSVQAFTLSSSLALSFPELKDDFVSGKFYKDMQEQGIPLQANGSINLNGITRYAALAQKEAQLNAKLEELNKPGEGAIPDANPTTPQQPAADAPMDKQMAQAIAMHVAGGNSHPRSEEAKQFLQNSVRR